jgi:hypothetical protein
VGEIDAVPSEFAGGYRRPIGSVQHIVPWVVLDATVFGGHDRYLESAAGRLLRDESAAGRLRIAVPEGVLIESEANHRRAVQAAREKLVASHEALRQFSLPSPQGRDLRPWRLRYREELEQVLLRASGELLTIPAVSHLNLLERAAARRRPFDGRGEGYREALIWESVLELLDRRPEPVVIVSDSHAAFSETRAEPELAADLVEELAERGHPGRVRLYFELSQFVAQIPRVRELASGWRHSISENPAAEQALKQKLLEVSHADADAVIAADLPAGKVRTPRFVNFTKPRNLRLEEAWVSPTGSSLLDVALTVDYTLEFEIPTSPSSRVEPVAKPWEWTPVRSSSTIVLRFEVIQHHPADNPEEFGARLVGWSDPREPLFAGSLTGSAP